MANLNINAGAAGNPLDALLNGRNPYGTLGGLLVPLGAGYTTEGGDTVYGNGYLGPNDPRYQAAQQYLSNNNLTQLRDTNIGGPGEAIDPSKVTYDPQYGLVTSPGNVKSPSDVGGWVGPALIAAATAYMGGAAAGLWGAPGAAGADAAGAAAGGVGDISTSDLGALGTVGGEGAPATAAGSSGLLGSLGDSTNGLLGQAGTWIENNPLRALGLAQTAYGLLGSKKPAQSGGGSLKGGSGGGGLTGGGMQPQFYTNPYTMAQLQRYRSGGY